MALKELLKELREKDEDVEIREDTPLSFRIFVYKQRAKFPITAYIDRQKEFTITKISDYPKQETHLPICVVRVERLLLRKKAVKRKRNTNGKQTITNISSRKRK